MIIGNWGKTSDEVDESAESAVDYDTKKAHVRRVSSVAEFCEYIEGFPDGSINKLVFGGHSSKTIGCGIWVNDTEAMFPIMLLDPKNAKCLETLKRTLSPTVLLDFQICDAANGEDENSPQTLAYALGKEIKACPCEVVDWDTPKDPKCRFKRFKPNVPGKT